MSFLGTSARVFSLLALSAGFGAVASADVTFNPRLSQEMVDYITRAKVPPTFEAPIERDFVIESASCSPEYVPSDLPGGADGREIVCRLYMPGSDYHDKTTYEGGVELITIFGGVNLMAYGDLVSAVDIACKAARANASAPWTYACTAGSVTGQEDKTSDN